jgi:hypothetical protein
MRFEWDKGKNDLNRRKHRVAFETAAIIFEDPYALTRPDFSSEDEERWITLGAVESGLVLFVVHTYHEEDEELVIRIISARKAGPRERLVYEEAHKNSKRRHKDSSRNARRRH